MATGLMEEECARIARDRCDCIHGCFVGNSLQHSPKALVTMALPKILQRAKAPAGPDATPAASALRPDETIA